MIICKQHDANLNKFKYKFNLIAILQMTKVRDYFLTLFRTEKIVFYADRTHLKVSEAFVRFPMDAVCGSLHFAQTR